MCWGGGLFPIFLSRARPLSDISSIFDSHALDLQLQNDGGLNYTAVIGEPPVHITVLPTFFSGFFEPVSTLVKKGGKINRRNCSQLIDYAKPSYYFLSFFV